MTTDDEPLRLSDAGQLVIPPGEAAVITIDGMTRLSLLVPELKGAQKNDVPQLLLYLTAVMVRGERDPAFLLEQIEWFMAHKQ